MVELEMEERTAPSQAASPFARGGRGEHSSQRGIRDGGIGLFFLLLCLPLPFIAALIFLCISGTSASEVPRGLGLEHLVSHHVQTSRFPLPPGGGSLSLYPLSRAAIANETGRELYNRKLANTIVVCNTTVVSTLPTEANRLRDSGGGIHRTELR